jgi:phenylalanyl-tRNA synthetase beta subunit
LEVNNKKEIVLDISATANRSDSLSIQGISSEIAALLNKTITNFGLFNKHTQNGKK